jgi:hypothetical protein
VPGKEEEKKDELENRERSASVVEEAEKEEAAYNLPSEDEEAGERGSSDGTTWGKLGRCKSAFSGRTNLSRITGVPNCPLPVVTRL